MKKMQYMMAEAILVVKEDNRVPAEETYEDYNVIQSARYFSMMECKEETKSNESIKRE